VVIVIIVVMLVVVVIIFIATLVTMVMFIITVLLVMVVVVVVVVRCKYNVYLNFPVTCDMYVEYIIFLMMISWSMSLTNNDIPSFPHWMECSVDMMVAV
jgi:hypothetical protein